MSFFSSVRHLYTPDLYYFLRRSQVKLVLHLLSVPFNAIRFSDNTNKEGIKISYIMNLQSKFNVMLKSEYNVIVKDIFSLNIVN